MGNVRGLIYNPLLSSANPSQGAKANQKRERNQKQAKTGPTSQSKSNQQAMNIMCQVCRQTFLQTTKAPAYVSFDSYAPSELHDY